MRLWIIIALGLGLGAARTAVPAARAQTALHDPLTPAEADQVRDTAGRLDQRVPLLLSFAEERLQQFEQVRLASPRPPGRDAQLYALLRQYAEILPEFDDAVDDITSGATTSETKIKYKPVKTLPPVIARIEQLQVLLRHIQTASSPADLATYRYQLENCLDVTADSLQNAQQDLGDTQTHAARH